MLVCQCFTIIVFEQVMSRHNKHYNFLFSKSLKYLIIIQILHSNTDKVLTIKFYKKSILTLILLKTTETKCELLSLDLQCYALIRRRQ